LRALFPIVTLLLLAGCSATEGGGPQSGIAKSPQQGEGAQIFDAALKYAECGADQLGRFADSLGRAMTWASKGEVGRAFGQMRTGSQRAQRGSGCLSDLASLVGANLSQLLSEDEQEEVVMLQGRALSETRDGEAVANRFPSGTSVQVTASSTRQETREVVALRDSEVEEPDDLKVIGKTYVVSASSGATLRVGASTSAAEVRSLSRSETFIAAASVAGQDGNTYILVSENNKWVGYVPAKAVEPAGAADQPVVVRAAESPRASDGSVAVAMNAQTTCRTLQAQARATDSQTAEDTKSYCRAPDGAWVID
jgi:hypothetical protein